MATAFHQSRPDNGPSTLSPAGHLSVYPRGLSLPVTELDFKDNRYPTALAPHTRRTSTMLSSTDDRAPWKDAADDTPNWPQQRSTSDPLPQIVPLGWKVEGITEKLGESDRALREDNLDGHHSPQPTKSDSVVSYALPAGAAPARRVVERYSLEENITPSAGGSGEPKPLGLELSSMQESPTASQHQQKTQPSPDSREQPTTILPSTPRHPSPPGPGVGAGLSNNANFSPIVPSSASPSFDPSRMSIPISPNPRASAQFPTYITPTTQPNPVNPVFSAAPAAPQEEVCVECAMRDQDMADVDATGPGVWDRESDVLFEELVRREHEDEIAGVLNFDLHPSRPRAKGGRLTEQNLKIWLTMNPREPSSRQQTMEQYIKSQRTLLEAEALAHARAMQEARQIDNRMRDAYSQLRRSAYDTGSSAAPIDDMGGVRIKSPSSPTAPSGPHVRSHSREITLLENGMIVEHVDVRREEREQRERRRKEERRERSRARKSSRASGVDATSVYSTASVSPYTDPSIPVKPNSRYSLSSSTRPTSVLTAPLERPPSLPRAVSQASFSDVHSIGSASPRRTRFFGFKNLSTGFKSQDSLAVSGMSGSMVDMHVALQREAYAQQTHSPVDLSSRPPSLRHGQTWPPAGGLVKDSITEEVKPKKKKNGLVKIWRIVTGHTPKGNPNGISGDHSALYERTEDDLPLAPPPPLSYLVDRRAGDLAAPGRHASTPSLPSVNSPKNGSPGMSPPTAPSSLLPSPTSSRPSGADRDMGNEVRKVIDHDQEHLDGLTEEGAKLAANQRNVHNVTSEPDMRARVMQSSGNGMPTLTVPRSSSSPRPQSTMLSREKSLPPLPGEVNGLRPPMAQPEIRPRTLYTYDPRQLPLDNISSPNNLQPPRPSFRAADVRRQSFGGMTSRPHFQTMPTNGLFNPDQLRLPGGKYDEFGISRRSLGRLENVLENQNFSTSPSPTPAKRKSRFGFAALLGRRSRVYESNPPTDSSHEFPALRTSGSDGRDEVVTNGYATSTSRHSTAPRASVTSRKVIEELVEQDPNFVAYRYPSNDQHLDLLR